MKTCSKSIGTIIIAAVFALSATPAALATDDTTDTAFSSDRTENTGKAPLPPRANIGATTTTTGAKRDGAGQTGERPEGKATEQVRTTQEPGPNPPRDMKTTEKSQKRVSDEPIAGIKTTTIVTERPEKQGAIVKGEKVKNPAGKKTEPFDLGIDLRPYLGMAILLVLAIVTGSTRASTAPANGKRNVISRRADI